MTLAVPLSGREVAAACRLHQQIIQFRLPDAALIRLGEVLPGFDAEACLLKSVAINTLYATQVYAISRMAQQLHVALAKINSKEVGPELVEKIASLPTGKPGKSRKFVSFAAKFCHFYVDEKRFPIYDEAARNVIELHLGKRGYIRDSAHPYLAFCENLKRLRSEAGLKYQGRELDHYLWITGMYMRWLKQRNSKNPRVNADLLRVFKQPTPDQARELDVLLPAILGRAFKGKH